MSYVCEHTANTETRLKEYEIATEVMRRPSSFDPKLDPVVRVSMMGIRDRLQRYFENTREHERLQLVVPKGQYRAQFIETQSQPGTELQDNAQYLKLFWGSYLAPGRSNLIVHTEPLFFREGWETYVRNLYVNDPGKGKAALIDRLPELGTRDLHPSFHYLDIGEVQTTFRLLEFFHELGAQVSVRNGRLVSWHEMRHSNLVLVGCPRTSTYVDMLQEESNFMVMEDEIRNRLPVGGELPSYRGKRYLDAKLHRYREYVLITRRPGAVEGSVVTMIAANHGRAIEAATTCLTSAGELEKLLRILNGNSDPLLILPKRFQILMQVEMIDLDDEIVDVSYLSHRLTPE
ncbi:MAG: hypothetical protein WCE63_01190 [Acidobacteriaceae bacterium]